MWTVVRTRAAGEPAAGRNVILPRARLTVQVRGLVELLDMIDAEHATPADGVWTRVAKPGYPEATFKLAVSWTNPGKIDAAKQRLTRLTVERKSKLPNRTGQPRQRGGLMSNMEGVEAAEAKMNTAKDALLNYLREIFLFA